MASTCIHAEDPDPSKRLHCSFETRVSKAGMFDVFKNAKRYDAGKSDWFGDACVPFHIFPNIWKVVGDSVLHLAMGDYGETQKIAVFTFHDDCPKGSPGACVHIAVWLIGPDGFTPVESTNDAIEAYFCFKGMLQEAMDVKFAVSYVGGMPSNDAPEAPRDAQEPSSRETGTETRSGGGRPQNAP